MFPGHIDTTGLTLNDSTVDPSLSQIKGHLLAWIRIRRPPAIFATWTILSA